MVYLLTTGRPWEAGVSNIPDPPAHAYRSSDKLLSDERERLFHISPRHSIDGSHGSGNREGWYIGAVFSITVVGLTLILNVIVTTVRVPFHRSSL
jgi:hypothetical protein